jgi:hypothetical protein
MRAVVSTRSSPNRHTAPCVEHTRRAPGTLADGHFTYDETRLLKSLAHFTRHALDIASQLRRWARIDA